MNRLGPEQMNVETAPNVPSAEKPPEWQRRIREVGPVGLLVIGLGLALMSSRWLGTEPERIQPSDVQVRVVRTSGEEHPAPPLELTQPVTVTVRPAREPETEKSTVMADEDYLLPAAPTEQTASDPPSAIPPADATIVGDISEPDSAMLESDNHSELPTFVWDNQVVRVATRAVPETGEEEFVVTVDGRQQQTLRSPMREFSVKFHPASGYRASWDERGRTLTLVLQSGHPIWGLTYQFRDGRFELVDVDAYEPKRHELDNPDIDLLAQSAHLFTSRTSEHHQLVALAEQFVDLLHGPDVEERLEQFYRGTRSHLAERHWQRFWDQDRETWSTYHIALADVAIDPTDLLGYDRGPIFRLPGLPFGLHARSLTRPDRTRGHDVSFYIFEHH